MAKAEIRITQKFDFETNDCWPGMPWRVMQGDHEVAAGATLADAEREMSRVKEESRKAA